MANLSTHSPGSRAIKIPLHGNSSDSFTTPGRRRRNHPSRHTRLERTDSCDAPFATEPWSTASPASSSASGSSSRIRDSTLLHTQRTIASPSETPARRGLEVTTTTGGPSSTTHKKRKDKHRAADDDTSPPNTVPAAPLSTGSFYSSPLGPSMLSSSSYKSITLNTHLSGDPDEPARLITYTKHSQGFTWNDELFLPSYLMGRRFGGGRGHGGRRRWGGGYDNGDDDDMDGVGDFDEEADYCPVTDIFVTDEEAAAMMP